MPASLHTDMHTHTNTHTPHVAQHPSHPEVCLIYTALSCAEPSVRPAVKMLTFAALLKLKENSFQETEMGRKQCTQTSASAHVRRVLEFHNRL